MGTGADIPYVLNKGYDITAIDYSSDMLKQAQEKFKDQNITFTKMDAQQLEFKDKTLDFVIANLILSVVPKPDFTMTEIIRVLKGGGKVLIFDKFLTKNKSMTIGKRLLRPIVRLLGTDIGIEFYKVFKVVQNSCSVLEDKEAMFRGMYRKLIIVKKTNA
ncbi:class I SAM-dependent methyltransferase [Bacillus sp. B1-b2]|uniref:class I SAM-dependent methyltransferase n=1 Tax=Bacillus sp. B1-b2 TaxID=2653201 RepID=UPI001D0336B5|nr:class I SAM-dependent methyltransferase [Bacillus sp. B1-b2]